MNDIATAPAAEVHQDDNPEMHLSQLFIEFGNKYKLNPGTVGVLLQRTAFRQEADLDGTPPPPISKADMIALLVMAMAYDLNPFAGEIKAYPRDGRVVPVVGVDGWSRIVNGRTAFDGMDFKYSENLIAHGRSMQCPEWVECHIFRNDRKHPVVVREYLTENYRDTPHWNTKTQRQLRHKAFVQCARYAFALTGIFDQDEVDFGVQAKRNFVNAPASALTGGLAQAKVDLAESDGDDGRSASVLPGLAGSLASPEAAVLVAEGATAEGATAEGATAEGVNGAGGDEAQGRADVVSLAASRIQVEQSELLFVEAEET